jgi:hypothetical protein
MSKLSLSNLYYGILIKHFPFNIIYKIQRKIETKQVFDWYAQFDKYNNNEPIENDDMKFIFGIISYDDITSNKANLLTMNDLDLIYLKDKNKYTIGIETIYHFETKRAEKNYFKRLLDQFTNWMEENGYNTKAELNPYGNLYSIFSDGYNINTEFDTIEDAYIMFKLLVNGYLTLD